MTDTSMDSRMSAIEQRINSMEESITNSLEVSMVRLLERINPPSPMSIRTQPPGGELAGRQNEQHRRYRSRWASVTILEEE